MEKISKAESASRVQAQTQQSPASSLGATNGAFNLAPEMAGNMAMQRLLQGGVLHAKLAVGGADDPAEHQADRMAEAAMRGTVGLNCLPAGPHDHQSLSGLVRRNTPSADVASGMDNLSLGAGRPMGIGERSFFESRYQADLSDVRVHDDDQAAVSAGQINARAFSIGSDIAFGRDQYSTDTSAGQLLLAHELAHVLQHRTLAPEARSVRRFPGDPNDPTGGGFVTPPELLGYSPPGSVDVPVELRVDAPSLAAPIRRRERDAELLTFHMPTTLVERFMFYAVPTAYVFPTPELARASHLRPPVHERLTPPVTPPVSSPVTTTTGTPPPTVTPPAVTPTPTVTTPAVTTPAVTAPAVVTPPAVGSTVHTPDGQSHLVVGSTPEAIVTTTFTRFAVGAGSTSLLNAGGHFIVVDAGTFGPAGSAVADATLRGMEAQIGRGGVIAQIVITHAHADHMSLLVEMATRFQIRAIRINALQADRPDFQAILERIRQAHRNRVNAEADRVRGEMANEQPRWEAADRGDPMTRSQRWGEIRDQRMRTAMEAIPDIMVERLVPGVGGRLAITSMPIEPAAFRPQTAGTPSEVLAPGVRAPAVVDPEFADELVERAGRGPTEARLDRFSSSWLVDVRGHTRFLVLPDIRATDFANILHSFRREVTSLGMEARFQVW
ncbi:MAG TPA: DUF4157 domain-containing protein, partial [Pyrinomonadaceae bacterium]